MFTGDAYVDPSPAWTRMPVFAVDANLPCLRMKKDSFELEDRDCANSEVYFCQWDCLTHGVVTPMTCPNGVSVPNDYFKYFGSYYKVKKAGFSPKTHDEASGICAGNSAKLITVDSADEYTALVGLAGMMNALTITNLTSLF